MRRYGVEGGEGPGRGRCCLRGKGHLHSSKACITWVGRWERDMGEGVAAWWREGACAAVVHAAGHRVTHGASESIDARQNARHSTVCLRCLMQRQLGCVVEPIVRIIKQDQPHLLMQSHKVTTWPSSSPCTQSPLAYVVCYGYRAATASPTAAVRAWPRRGRRGRPRMHTAALQARVRKEC